MGKPLCVFEAPLMTRSGYGDWAMTLVKSLLRHNKYDIHIIPTIWGACSKRNLDAEMNDPEGREVLNRVLRGPLARQPDIYMKVSIPNELVPHGKYNIILTAGIESSVPAAPWIEGINRANLCIVTSQHVKDVFTGATYTKKLPNGTTEPLKMKTPCEILFWGADTRYYHKTQEKVPSLEEVMAAVKESFSFLFVGQWTAGNMRADRKAIGFLIKTFLETFAGIDNPPALILKTSGAQLNTMDRYDCINKVTEVTNLVKGSMPNAKLPNVYLLHGELTDVEMNALYNHEKVKAHVSFVHGEGFSAPALLQTLTGKPTIYPHWSGHLDFLNPNYATFFPGKLVPIPDEALNDWFIKEAQWFDVDYAEAGKMMKNVFYNYDGYTENAERLRVENMEKFSITAMDKVFHALLDKYVPQFAVEETIKLPKLKRISLPTVKPVNVPETSNPVTASNVVIPASGCTPQNSQSIPETSVKPTIDKVK